jgi:iron complex outermembrane receptor protein
MMRILSFCFLLILAKNSFTQTSILRGVVTDESNGESLPFATVFIKSINLGAYTDLDGKYELKNVPPGKHLVKFSFVGYKELTEEIVITSGQTLELNIKLSPYDIFIDPDPIPFRRFPQVNIEGTRATYRTPMAFTEITSKEIEPLNNGQDMPYLLRFTPSLIATSDAGNGVGYTSSWIRGSDPSRINVTINGIPLNDPESQQVFWVNTPDFGSSANSIQVQRGIGTSANGSASFGGAIKIETRGTQTTPYAETNHVFGSFNTVKNNIAFGTGLIKEKFIIEGRLSRISSDGYIDRATSDLKSYFTEAAYISDKTTLKATIFGGKEVTYQSWYGTPIAVIEGDADSIVAFAERNYFNVQQTDNLINSGRTYNFYDYENQVDDYQQNHTQLHLSHQFTPSLRVNISGHYTHGKGFFEEYKEDQHFSSYGLNDLDLDSNVSITSTDLVRRRWLRNDFYGGVVSIIYVKNNWESVIGGAYNEYRGKHFGELTWMEYAGNNFIGDHYYDGKSLKRDGNVYWKNTFTINQKLDLYADLQVRNVNYVTTGIDNDQRAYQVNRNMTFSNPKFGFVYTPNQHHRAFASIAQAGKEPNRNDFISALADSLVKPEYMTDLELGYQWTKEKATIGLNLYYMNYKDQLVLTGELNDVGAPLRTNVKQSFRRGIEVSGNYSILENFLITGNFTLSQNKISSFNEYLYNYDYEALVIEHNNTDIAFSPSMSGSGQLSYRYWTKNQTQFLEGAWMTKFVGKQYLDNTQNDRLSLNPYIVNDLRLSYHLSTRNKSDIQLNFWANNILGEVYSSNGYTYSYVGETRVTEIFHYPQAGRNYSIGLTLKI